MGLDKHSAPSVKMPESCRDLRMLKSTYVYVALISTAST